MYNTVPNRLQLQIKWDRQEFKWYPSTRMSRWYQWIKTLKWSRTNRWLRLLRGSRIRLPDSCRGIKLHLKTLFLVRLYLKDNRPHLEEPIRITAVERHLPSLEDRKDLTNHRNHRNHRNQRNLQERVEAVLEEARWQRFPPNPARPRYCRILYQRSKINSGGDQAQFTSYYSGRARTRSGWRHHYHDCTRWSPWGLCEYSTPTVSPTVSLYYRLVLSVIVLVLVVVVHQSRSGQFSRSFSNSNIGIIPAFIVISTSESSIHRDINELIGTSVLPLLFVWPHSLNKSDDDCLVMMTL